MKVIAYRLIEGSDLLLTEVGDGFATVDEAKNAIRTDALSRDGVTTYRIDRVTDSTTHRATPRKSVDLVEQ